jgi:hypothetical protein
MLNTAKPESEDGQVESRQDGDPSGDTDFRGGDRELLTRRRYTRQIVEP